MALDFGPKMPNTYGAAVFFLFRFSYLPVLFLRVFNETPRVPPITANSRGLCVLVQSWRVRCLFCHCRRNRTNCHAVRRTPAGVAVCATVFIRTSDAARRRWSEHVFQVPLLRSGNRHNAEWWRMKSGYGFIHCCIHCLWNNESVGLVTIIYDFEPANEGDPDGKLLSLEVQPNYRSNNKKLHVRTEARIGTIRLSEISHNVAPFQCRAC